MSIDFRKNANVLTAVHLSAKAKQRTPSDPYVVDGYELHARPDLVERLKKLMANVSEARLEFAFGIPMLLTPTGRVFATAGGTHRLSLFLPEEETWGEPHSEYGKPWRHGFAWTVGRPHTPKDESHLISVLRLAFTTAVKLDEEP